MKLHSFSVFVLLIFILSSCISTKTVQKYMRSSLPTSADSIVKQDYKLKDYTLLLTDSLHKTDSVVDVNKKVSYFIPAIIFWGWNHTLECNVNKKIFVKEFIDVFNEKSKEFTLSKYLGERKLTIEIEKVPSSFIYTNSGAVIFAFIAYSYVFNDYIDPVNQTFRVRYKIVQGDIEMANDVYETRFNEIVANNYSTTEDFIATYVSNRQYYFRHSCEELFDRIMENL